MLKLTRTLALVAATCPAPALAGGFEFPAAGTEALGRGGAFTAKADSPLALEYNVAGLAQQRGTRLLFDSNLHFGSYSFQRQALPGQPEFPLVEDQGPKPFYGPFFGASSDFGYFDRWTFAVGAYGPNSIGRRRYPLADDGSGPARYDVIATNLLTIFPTLAAAVRPSRFFDIGLGLHLAFGTYELSSASFAKANATPEGPCRDRLEDPRCDSRSEVSLKSGVNPLLSLGFLVHPTRSVDIGLHVRSAANLGIRRVEAQGTLQAVTPNGTILGPVDDATFLTDLPWIFRVGARYVYRKGFREVLDLEVNATYEAWSVSEGEGSRLQATSPLSNAVRLNVLLPHYYRDTYSLRLGGAYNQPAGPATLTLRLGLFYDSSATASEDTRLDFNTLPKLGVTFGLGARLRGVMLNLAYAYLHSFERTVTDGRLRPIDGTTVVDTERGKETGMPLTDAMGNPAPAVNNGTYRGQNHTLSLGLTVLFDELVRGDAWARRPR